jgi:RHS repeat-associated protein
LGHGGRSRQVATLADGEGHLTTFERDGFDRPLKTRFPNKNSSGSSTSDYIQYGYDLASNTVTRRGRDAAVISFVHDDLNRLKLKDWATGPGDVAYTYDNLGRLKTSATSSQTLSFGYDALGRNISQAGPLATLTYQYDLAGRRTRQTWPDATYFVYDYDMAGDMTAIRENGATTGDGVLATFDYNNLGMRTSLTRGNGVITTYGHDALGRLTDIAHDFSSTTYDLDLGLTYTAANQIRTREASNDAFAWNDHSNVDLGYTANNLNQLKTAGATTLTYDSNGNLTTDGAKTFVYDIEHRLTQETASGTTLSYDPAGRLYETGPSTVRFAYDGIDLVAEYDSSNQLQRRDVFGPDTDEPLVWYEGAGTTLRRWFAADERGSTIAVTNGNGVATKLYAYDEYGQPSYGMHRFLYTGQVWLPEIGIYSYKSRNYDPQLGIFMQMDPVGYASGPNLYCYVHDDPVNFSDPFGLADVDEVLVTTYRLQHANPPPQSLLALQQDFRGLQQALYQERSPARDTPSPESDKPLPPCMAAFLKRYYPTSNVDKVRLHNGSPFELTGNSVTFGYNINLAYPRIFSNPLSDTRHIFHEYTHVRQYEAGTLSIGGYVVDAIKSGFNHDKIPSEIQADANAAVLGDLFPQTPEGRSCPQ